MRADLHFKKKKKKSTDEEWIKEPSIKIVTARRKPPPPVHDRLLASCDQFLVGDSPLYPAKSFDALLVLATDCEIVLGAILPYHIWFHTNPPTIHESPEAQPEPGDILHVQPFSCSPEAHLKPGEVLHTTVFLQPGS